VRSLLFLAYDFPPIASPAAQRARQLARHLPAHGWRPLVLTPRTGVSWARDPSTGRGLTGVGIHRTGSIEPSRVAGRLGVAVGPIGGRGASVSGRLREWLLVPDDHVGWVPFAVAAALRRAGRVQAILTTSPPASAHLAGMAVALAGRRPWVADFQDPWSLGSFQRWRGRWRPRVEERLERAVLRRADRVVATTPWLAGELARRGAGDRVTVVPNGYDPGEYPSDVPGDGTFAVVHTGSFYGPRSPEPLLRAVGIALRSERGMRLHLRLRLVGSEDAANAARLDDVTRRLGLGDVVERTGQVPRRRALAAMRGANVLVLVTDAAEGGHGLVPLKLYEYLGSGRAVLALAPPEGEAGRLARAAGAAVVDPSDVAGAAGALRRLYRRWRSEDGEVRLDPSVVEPHRWDLLAGRLATVLDEAVSRKPTRDREAA
jgi:glycosyltransferase involved in cell wall biosynthesis